MNVSGKLTNRYEVERVAETLKIIFCQL